MPGVELGTYYVSVTPSARGIGGALQSAIGPEAESAASKAAASISGGIKAGAEQGSSAAAQAANSSMAGIASTAQRLIGGIAVGGLVHAAFGEAEEAQKVGAQTEAVLRSTGNAAGVSAAHIGDLATSLSNMAGVDDEVIQSGENLLLTFKSIRNEAGAGNDIFDQATRIALDMSKALGTDLQSSVTMVGKALEDPIRGVTALRRVGANFTAEQQEQIKTLVDTGRQMDAQKLILRELTSEYGGSAAAQATAADKARVAFGNLEESVGTALMPAISAAARVTTTMADAFNALPGPVQTTVSVVGVGAVGWTLFGGAVKSAATSLVGASSALVEWAVTSRISTAATTGLAAAMAEEAAAATAAGAASSVAAAEGTAASVALGPIGLAAGAAAAVAGLVLFSRHARQSSIDSHALADEVNRTGAALDDVYFKSFAKDLAGDRGFVERSRKLGFSVEQIGKAMTGTRQEFDRFMVSYENALRDAKGLKDGDPIPIGGDVQKLVKLRESFTDAHAEARALSAAQKELGVSTDETSAAMAEASKTPYTDALANMRQMADDAKSSLHEVASAAREALGIRLAVPEAVDKQADAQADFEDTLRKAREAGYRGDFLTGTDATSRDIRAKYRDLERANADLVGAWREAGVAGDELKAKVNGLGSAFADTQNVYLGRSAINDYTASLWQMVQATDAAQARVDALNFSHLADAWNEAYRKMGGTLGLTPAQVGNPIVMGGINALIEMQGGTPPGRASGGPVRAGELYRVNENRMEYFRPGVDGTVLPLAPAGVGGSTVIEQHFHDARPSAAQIARESVSHANWALKGRSGG